MKIPVGLQTYDSVICLIYFKLQNYSLITYNSLDKCKFENKNFN